MSEGGQVKEKVKVWESVKKKKGIKVNEWKRGRYKRGGFIPKANGEAYLRVTSLVLRPSTVHPETLAHCR